MFSETRIDIKGPFTAPNPYLTGVGKHIVGSQYVQKGTESIYELVEINKNNQFTVVNRDGVGFRVDLKGDTNLKRTGYSELHWFAWRSNTGNKLYHSPLSNFWTEIDGLTAEHRFQSAKTYDIQERIDILSASSPNIAKKKGRKCTLREDWEFDKLSVMKEVVLEKFIVNEFARDYLFATFGHLEERNTWNDTYWGTNLKGEGENKLGKLLMYVRKELKNAGYGY